MSNSEYSGEEISLTLIDVETQFFLEDVYQYVSYFNILLKDKVIGSIEVINTSLNLDYIDLLNIEEEYRCLGIGSYVLTKYFSGYFISAGNNRVIKLYNRIGRHQSMFTDEECRILANNTGMWGTFRVN